MLTYFLIFDRVDIIPVRAELPEDSAVHAHIAVSSECVYDSFCDDFGPMNLGMIYKFCAILDTQLECSSQKRVALCIEPESHSITNAVFLMGSYMMIRHDIPPLELTSHFACFEGKLLSYRDVSPGEQNFHLLLQDCWQGIWRAREIGWVDFGPNGFNYEEYAHYDNPLNADLHQVVPDKFLAMKGPKSTPKGVQWVDKPAGYREFRDRKSVV